MKFTAVLLALAVSVAALPAENAGSAVDYDGGYGGPGARGPHFPPVPPNLTVRQAQDKCGDDTTLSCCDEADYSGDSSTIDNGFLAGALSGLIGHGSGAEGVGVFKDCSKIGVPVPLLGAGVDDILDAKCKTNVACCQKDKVDGSGSLVGVNIGCIALGSLL